MAADSHASRADACKVLGVEADGLDALWAKAKKSKFGGGFCEAERAEGGGGSGLRRRHP